MNKLFSTTLLVMYLIPAIGVNVSVHYCGGEFASLTINGIGKADKCTCGKERVKKKCCKDKELSFALTDDQYKTPPLAFTCIELPDIAPPFTDTYTAPHYPYAFITNAYFHALQPPDCIKQPLYILHQVFLI